METLCEVTAASETLTVGGRDYRLSPLRLVDYGEMERHLQVSRPDVVEEAKAQLAGLPPAVQRRLLAATYSAVRRGAQVSARELLDWMSTAEGIVRRFWLSLRREHPEITILRAETLLKEAAAEGTNLGTRLQAASGLPLGN